MLKINPNPQFSADVKISEPGNPEPTTVKITFKYKTRKQLTEFVEKVDEKGIEESLQEIVVSWDGIDAECNKENISLLAQNYPAAAGEIFSAYYRELFASKVKN